MKLSKLHIYFWITSVITYVLGLFYYNSNETISINIHDTYFVIGYLDFIILFSLTLAFLGLIYYLHHRFKTSLIVLLSQIHIVLILVSMLIFIIGTLYIKIDNTHSEFPLFDDLSKSSLIFSISLFVFLMAQPIVIINSLYSSFKHILKNK